MTKSASEMIHAVVCALPIGHKFTARQLRVICRSAGTIVSEGAVTGFIFRAKEKGMLEEVGRQAPRPKHSKSAVIYRIIRHIAWDFGAPGNGRVEGAANVGTTHSNQSSLPFLENLLADTGISGLADEGVIGFKSVPLMFRTEPKKEEPKHPFVGEVGTTTETFQVNEGGLADLLVSIAAKVDILENQPPQKTLADFTSAELVAELARRLGAEEETP